MALLHAKIKQFFQCQVVCVISFFFLPPANSPSPSQKRSISTLFFATNGPRRSFSDDVRTAATVCVLCLICVVFLISKSNVIFSASLLQLLWISKQSICMSLSVTSLSFLVEGVVVRCLLYSRL